MTAKLQKMLEEARQVTMTPEEREAQRISFVYGNCKITDDRVTRESVKQESEKLAKTGGRAHGIG